MAKNMCFGGGGFFRCHISEVFCFLKKNSLDFSIDVAQKCDGILNFVLLSYLVPKLYYGLITSLAISQIRKKKKGRKASGVHAVVHPLAVFLVQ
jgi:hypothetical protein